MLVLNTGGGTVTGYGLAAAQLARLKAAGIKLTICVEQVAASGGYMMVGPYRHCPLHHLSRFRSPFLELRGIS